MPSSAASLSVSCLEQAMKSGGCGFCTGRGRIAPGPMSIEPCHSNCSSRQAEEKIRRASSICGYVSSGRTPYIRISCFVAPRPAPMSTRPPVSESSIAARSATRTGCW